MDTLLFSSTKDVMAKSPRFRRKSSTWVDAIHDLPERTEMAPAQLYSTESGRLFHSGKIAIVTVGLPARGKTHISVALARYLRWLGVKTRVFHLGDYRRASMGPGQDVPQDYFFANGSISPDPIEMSYSKLTDRLASATSVLLREKIQRKCREDIYRFFERENGQIAIYDAVNALSATRQSLSRELKKMGIETLFIESFCDDQRLIEENVRRVKISSPDYEGWSPEEAISHYIARVENAIPLFQTMDEKDLNYIKMINAGEKFTINNCSFGYLSYRIVFYLLNLHIKPRRTYFARAGVSDYGELFKSDAPLSDAGREYAKNLTESLNRHRDREAEELTRQDSNYKMRPLIVWTSTRQRTVETAQFFEAANFKVRKRSQMSQINPGIAENLTETQLKDQYPEEIAKSNVDPYHYRFSNRGESYHDLAVRLEPIILELERAQDDILVIAHESVLRVLYGYLMACNAFDIPKLMFPRNEIVEIIPASYHNIAERIQITKS